MAGLSPRRFVRYGVLTSIAAFSLGYVLLALVFTMPGRGQPRLCMDVSDNGTILSAANCGSALERRGVGNGSRIDLGALSVTGRVALLWPKPNVLITLPIAGMPQEVEFTPATLKPDPILTALLYARIAALILCLAVAGLLVAFRPSKMSWAFFLFIAFSAPAAAAHPVIAQWSPRLAIAGTMLWQVLLMLAAVAFLTFVLRFPGDAATGRLADLERTTPLIFICAAIIAVMPSEQFFIAGRPAHGWTIGSEVALAMIFGLALGTIVVKYVLASGADRQKLGFVLWCLFIGFSGFIADAFLGAFGFPNWLARSVGLLTIVVPIGVAYAVVRHRVIDVRVVISHTLMYSGVVATVVVLFSIVENILGAVYHESATSTALRFVLFAVGVATAVALFFAHEHVMRLIERCMFRSRLASEQRMAQLAAELPDAVSAKELAEMLANEPADAMRLTSAATFLRVGEDRFERLESFGWKPEELPQAREGERLVNVIAEMHRAAHLRHDVLEGAHAPADDRRPEVALPLMLRGKLLGFALYGAHRNGAALDRGERELLGALATPATAAFAHIESIALRARNRRLEEENAQLRKGASAIIATIAVLLCVAPRSGWAAPNVAPPDLNRVPQLTRVADGYEDRATHFSGTAESHWSVLAVSGTQVIVGMLDARKPIAGNDFEVLIFDASSHLLGTVPVPRRPLITVRRADLDVRYSIDRDPPSMPCCRGDYVDVFVRVTTARAVVAMRAYGPPIGAASGAAGGVNGPGLQQTSADSNAPVLDVGMREVRRLAFDHAGTLWASDSHSVVAIDPDSRRVVARHAFAPQCSIVDMVGTGTGSAVALSCGEIDALSTAASITRLSSASASARLVSAGGALWLIDGNRACLLTAQRSCARVDGASVAAVDGNGALIVAQRRGSSTALVRVASGAGSAVTVATVPWQVSWLEWSGAPIAGRAGSTQAYVVQPDASVLPLCTLPGPVAAFSIGGYGGTVAALTGGQLETLDATGCKTLETFPALHPSAFAFSNTLLAVGYASSDIIFSAVPANR